MKKSLIAAAAVLLAVCFLFSAGCVTEQTAKSGDTVSVYYTLTLEDGTVDDSNLDRDPLEFVIDGDTTTLIKGFQNAVKGMKVGETKTVVIAPADGYGEYSYENTIEYGVADIEEYLERETVVGDTFDMVFSSNGAYSLVKGEVVSIDRDAGTAVVAINERLAGETLTFEITLNSITPAK